MTFLMASSVVVITIKIRAITPNFNFDSLYLLNASYSHVRVLYKIKSKGKIEKNKFRKMTVS